MTTENKIWSLSILYYSSYVRATQQGDANGDKSMKNATPAKGHNSTSIQPFTSNNRSIEGKKKNYNFSVRCWFWI